MVGFMGPLVPQSDPQKFQIQSTCRIDWSEEQACDGEEKAEILSSCHYSELRCWRPNIKNVCVCMCVCDTHYQIVIYQMNQAVTY